MDDYLMSFQQLAPFGNYFVVNVSSPNTPGLRTLQDKVPLTNILLALRGYAPGKPIFVKIAPDLDEEALGELLEVVLEVGIAGIVATNTTITRDGLSVPFEGAGGLSGAPLKAKAEATLRFLAQRAPKELLLIGVGGIFTGDDVYERIHAGAHLVQMYTGWVYGGPETVPDVLEDFVGRLEREGIRSLEELRRR
jgi:dihydroorotate dehydrogenase